MDAEEKGAKIMIVDDETQIRKLLKVALTAHGYQVDEIESGETAVKEIAMSHPDLVILDLGLPDIEGIDVVKQVREWSKVPIIILSVRGEEEEKVSALDAGADDYVQKPFGMRELLARIRTAMRHAAKSEDEPVISIGDLTVDISRRLVTLKGKEIKLTPIEYDILKTLAQYSDRIITHKQLLRLVWGPTYENETHYLRVYIAQLRRKIETDPSRPKYILTEPGVGYRLSSP